MTTWKTSKPTEDMEQSINELLSSTSQNCAYCGQKTSFSDEECSFCKAPLNTKKTAINAYLDESDLLKSYREYQDNYHVYDLLKLLTNARKNKEQAFQIMQSIRKNLPGEDSALAEEEYREWIQRVNLLSNIVEHKLGKKIQRVTGELLESVKTGSHITTSKHKKRTNLNA